MDIEDEVNEALADMRKATDALEQSTQNLAESFESEAAGLNRDFAELDAHFGSMLNEIEVENNRFEAEEAESSGAAE